jgi:hypothetical protein
VKLFLTSKQVAAHLGISSQTVLNLNKKGLLTDVSFGGQFVGRHTHAYDRQAVLLFKKTYRKQDSTNTNRALAGASNGDGPTVTASTVGTGILTRLGHLERRTAGLETVQARIDTKLDQLIRLWT